MNSLQSNRAEKFFNRLETEQDAMVMQYIKQSTHNDRVYVSRPRTNHYRCNKRLDHMMSASGSILRAASPKLAAASTPASIAQRRSSPRRGVQSTSTTARPVSVTANTIYPIGTR